MTLFESGRQIARLVSKMASGVIPESEKTRYLTITVKSSFRAEEGELIEEDNQMFAVRIPAKPKT